MKARMNRRKKRMMDGLRNIFGFKSEAGKDRERNLVTLTNFERMTPMSCLDIQSIACLLMVKPMDGWMDGRTDGRTDGWLGVWVGGRWVWTRGLIDRMTDWLTK